MPEVRRGNFYNIKHSYFPQAVWDCGGDRTSLYMPSKLLFNTTHLSFGDMSKDLFGEGLACVKRRHAQAHFQGWGPKTVINSGSSHSRALDPHVCISMFC